MAATAHAILLPEDEFKTAAEPALRRILRTLDFDSTDIPSEPFTGEVPQRLILCVDSFVVDAEQYRALRNAATSVGDTELLCTFLTAFVKPLLPTFRLPLIGYEEYDAAQRLIPKRLVGIPLTRVLYSPKGAWGALCSEFFALVSGTAEFVQGFKGEYPHWRVDLTDFLERFRSVNHERGVDVSWVQPLLDHIYGVDAPKFLED